MITLKLDVPDLISQINNYVNLYETYKREKQNKKYKYWNNDYWDVVKHKSEAKKLPGVYMIYSINWDSYKREVLYVGMSKNIRKRLERHNILTVLDRMPGEHNLIFVAISYMDNPECAEKEFIKYFNPPLNIEHNKVL